MGCPIPSEAVRLLWRACWQVGLLQLILVSSPAHAQTNVQLVAGTVNTKCNGTYNVAAAARPTVGGTLPWQDRTAASAEPTQEAEEAGDEPRNEVALVLAGTREGEEDEAFFTIGGEYERRLTEHLGIVAEVEYVSGPDTWVFAVPFVVRPTGGLKLFAGPGFERKPVHHESETHESAASTGGTRDNLFLWRVGTGYSWEFAERYVVGPSEYLDFIREKESEWTRAFVFGISLGVAF